MADTNTYNTLEERAEAAAGFKARGEANCTQAVLKVFQDKLELSKEKLMILGAGFAAGMGCMESTCGALIGAVMVCGQLTGGQGSARYSREIVKSFKERCGATICKELKGGEKGHVLCECPDCVKNAVLALGQVLEL